MEGWFFWLEKCPHSRTPTFDYSITSSFRVSFQAKKSFEISQDYFSTWPNFIALSPKYLFSCVSKCFKPYVSRHRLEFYKNIPQPTFIIGNSKIKSSFDYNRNRTNLFQFIMQRYIWLPLFSKIATPYIIILWHPSRQFNADELFIFLSS